MGLIKSGFANTALKMWPALPYLGLSLWLAWSVLAYSGGIWLSDVESSGENISKLFITTSITLCVTTIAAAFNGSLVTRLINKKSFLIAAGIIGAVGSLMLVIAGPYYLGYFIGTDSYPVFHAGGILVGFSSGIILLKCSMLYCVLTPRRVLLYTSLSHLLTACVYFIAIGIPPWPPIAGGPPLSGIVALTLVLPAAALLLSAANAKHTDTASLQVADEDDYLDIEPDFDPVGIRKLPSVFWKFLIMLFFFTTVIFMMRSVVVELHPVETTLHSSNLVMFFHIIIASVFVVLSLGFGSKRLNFGKIYSLIAVVLVVIIALLPILGVFDMNGNLVIAVATVLFEFILWCLLAFISYQRAVSPVVVVGFGYGVFMLGNTAGWFLGSSGLPQIIEGSMASIFYLVVAGVVLALAFLLFSERDFNRLFLPLDRTAPSLNELMQEDITAVATEDTAEGGEGKDPEQHRGRFMQKLTELSNSKGLSPRETEVLRFLAMGRSSDYIAEQLSISWNTARTHIHNIYVKLDVHSRQELIDLVDSFMSHSK